MILNMPQDCDNAPKRKVIRDFVIAFYRKDWGAIDKKLEDKFTFKVAGSRSIETKYELESYLNRNTNVVELTINDVLSHGKYGACSGIVRRKTEEVHVAYFFEFKSAAKNTIKVISEYKVNRQ